MPPAAHLNMARMLLAAAAAEPPSSARDQRIAGLTQYLSACKREQRNERTPRLPLTSPPVR